MDDGMRERAVELIADLIAWDAADDLERATGWTIVCACQEFGTVTLVGYFEQPAEALAFAERWGKELNADSPPGQGWTLSVKAVMPAS